MCVCESTEDPQGGNEIGKEKAERRGVVVVGSGGGSSCSGSSCSSRK